MERIIVPIVGGDSRSRAEQARVAFALGHHAEVYSDLDELLERPPNLGVVTVGDDGTPGFARWTVERVAAALAPSRCRFVDAGIIGGPPREGYKGPTFYISGPHAGDLAALALKARLDAAFHAFWSHHGCTYCLSL